MATKARDVIEKWGNAEGEKTGGRGEVGDTSYVDTPNDRVPSIGQSDRSVAFDESDADQAKIGGELATLFKDNNVHPVFIFGSKGSGKTSLLASLFRYIQLSVDSHAAISLIDDIFPATDEKWRKHATWARDVYYKKVNDSIDSMAPAATLEPSPFFVPVKLKLKTGKEAKFAFLEGRGEWYMPDESAEVPFKPFKGLLQGVLQQFNGKASVVYVAPFTTGGYARTDAAEGSRSADLRKSDLGLVGAINEYISLRRAHFHQDNHLFLMTKWDIFCRGIAGGSFYSPHSDEIQEVFSERFELAWTRFQNLEVSGVNQNKTYSAYCAGVIDGLSIQRAAQEDVAVIDRYPRRIWDWLYQCHTGGVLYEDMQPRRPSILDRFLATLRG
jgi:hypothetical protein